MAEKIKNKHLNNSLILKVGNFGIKFWEDFVAIRSFICELAVSFLYAIRHPRKVRWRETFYYMDNCGSDAVPIVVAVGFLMGFVLALQGAIQLTKFGAKSMVIDLVTLSMIKELGPLMTAIVATGRAGSAFAAEIGTMKVTEEVDALTTLGFDPYRFLVVPKTIALMVVLPMLTLLGDIAGIIGGMFITYFQLNISIPESFYKTLELITMADFTQGIVKSLIFAILISAVGCLRGFQTKNDAQSVGRSTTSAVVTGIFLIAVADSIISILFTF